MVRFAPVELAGSSTTPSPALGFSASRMIEQQNGMRCCGRVCDLSFNCTGDGMQQLLRPESGLWVGIC
jgi:hypothetical protein